MKGWNVPVRNKRVFKIISSSGLLNGVRWFETDVSDNLSVNIFDGQFVQEDPWPLKMGPVGTPETSFSKQLTSRNNPEDGRIQFYSGGSLRLRIIYFIFITFDR